LARKLGYLEGRKEDGKGSVVDGLYLHHFLEKCVVMKQKKPVQFGPEPLRGITLAFLFDGASWPENWVTLREGRRMGKAQWWMVYICITWVSRIIASTTI
jgi:hypothetical protein